MGLFKIIGNIFIDGGREADQTLDNVSNKAEKTTSVMSKIGGAAKIAAVGFAAVGGAAIAVGKIALDVGMKFDDAFDTIRIGTGKTGKDLEGLQKDFKDVYSEVDSTSEDVSKAIADLNTRTGATGKTLQTLAKTVLNLSSITGEDLGGNIANITRMFGDWSINTKNQVKAMDFLFKASQSTGIKISILTDKLVKFGGPLRQLGFDMETSAAMLGKWEKEGVNTDLVLGALRKSLSKFAKEGVKDVPKALDAIIKKIKEAGSAGEANAIAMELFGAKAGPDMAAAVREGRFEYNQLVKDLKNSKETIETAKSDTDDFGQAWEKIKHKIEIAIEPLGAALMGKINNLMPVAEKILKKLPLIAESIKTNIAGAIDLYLMPQLEKVKKWFDKEIPPIVNKLKPVLVDAFYAVGNAASELLPIFKQIKDTSIYLFFEKMRLQIESAKRVGESLASIFIDNFTQIMIYIQNAGKIIAMIGDIFKDAFEYVINDLMPPLLSSFEEWKPLLEDIYNQVVELASALLEIFLPVITTVQVGIMVVIRVIKLAFKGLQPYLTIIWKAILNMITIGLKNIKAIMEIILGVIKGDWKRAWNGLKTLLKGVWDGIFNVLIAGWNLINKFMNSQLKTIKKTWKTAWKGIGSVFGTVWDGIKKVFDSTFGKIWKGIKKLFNYIKQIKEMIPSIKLPKLPSLPSIPGLAMGGIIEQAGTVIVGEKGPELLNLNKGAKVTPLTGNTGNTIIIDKEAFRGAFILDDYGVDKIMDRIAKRCKRMGITPNR